ncbi:hypothetical protein W02_01240 [Nitrospira sp. KM1]|uniref:hypothetical protein n=1 Tax=Nitrospira sp. KM1 TaxID=1936990 RepID=UPI0013A7AF64|nr:hypothetical protein [Nitrospira sp. KM1]BCA52984.1 hypothetical protein W02_01240 [Nitrospira sp. KM1]
MIRNGSLIASHTDEIQRPAASVMAEPHDEEQFWDQADPYGRPGLLVLSSSFKILHINPEAEEMLRFLCSDDCRPDDCDWRPIHLKRLAGELLRPVRLHGVGIPDRAGIAYVRIVISIEEVVPRCAPSTCSRPTSHGREDLTHKTEG